MATIQTVTGPIDSADLGRTLMHEHLAIGYPGWESATDEPADPAEMLTVCIDRIEALKDLGYASLVDPCPSDLGRDPELMVAAAEATGFNIICATGLYHEAEGGHAHWSFRARFEDIVPVMADLFTRELTDGIGSTGVGLVVHPAIFVTGLCIVAAVAVEWTMTGTDPATGRQFTFRGSDHYEFADGLISEIRQWWTFDRDRLDTGLIDHPDLSP